MAWLWNQNSLKYRKNGSNKSLIYLQDYVNDINPNYIPSSVRSKYLAVRNSSGTVKVPLIQTSQIGSGTPYNPYRDCDINVFHNGAKCKPMLNKSALFFKINTQRSETVSTYYNTQVIEVEFSFSLLTKLPVSVVATVEINSKKTNFEIPAGSFTKSGKASATFEIRKIFPAGDLNSTYTYKVSFATGTYQGINFSGTVFSRSQKFKDIPYDSFSPYGEQLTSSPRYFPEFWIDRSNV